MAKLHYWNLEYGYTGTVKTKLYYAKSLQNGSNNSGQLKSTDSVLDPEGGSQKATLVVLDVVVSSVRVQKSLRLS